MNNTDDILKNYRGKYSQYWIERWGLIPELPTSFDNANSVYELVSWLQRAFKNLLDDFQQLESEFEDFKNALIDLLKYLIPELIRRYHDSAEFRTVFIGLLQDILSGEERNWVKDLLKELLEVDMREWLIYHLKDLLNDLELQEFFEEVFKELLYDLQTQVNTNKTSIATTNARIDNLIANAGNGTVPSELVDMRIGYNGKAYTTAGDAVRKQFLDISVLSQDYTVYFGFSTAPKFKRNGSILEITMPAGVRLFAVDKNGKLQATIYAVGSTSDPSLPTFSLTYNLNHNQALILNVDEKKVITTGIDYARNYKHVVLAYNFQGVLAAGDFIKYDARNIVLPQNYTLFFTNGKKPTITEKSGNVTIDMPTDSGTVLYAVDSTGKEVGKLLPSGGVAQYQSQYVLAHGQSLIWKIATNELVVQHINNARTQTDVVLAYNHAGYLSAGEFERYKTGKNDNVNLDNFRYSNYDFVLRQGQIGGHPENSIAGLLDGKSKGYNHARMSVMFTSDGHAILCHDAYLNYKIKNIDGTDTDTSVAISSLTLAELENNFDFGLYYGQQFQGMKVSTLDDLITASAYNGIKLDLELKVSVTDEMVDYIVDRLVLNGLVDSTLISSGRLAVLDKFYAKCPALSFGYICNPNNTRVDEVLRYRHLNNQLRLDIFDTSTLTVSTALYAKNNGIKIKVGSCYSVADIRKWIALGADVIEVAYIPNPIETLTKVYNT